MGFSPSSALRFGWETFKKRPWLFVGAFVLVALAQVVVEGLSRSMRPSAAPSRITHFSGL